MKIYLAGSMVGGRDFEEGVKEINNALIKLGHEVTSPFVVDPEINAARFPDLSGVELDNARFEDDLKRIQEADCVVMEVSQPSHGVGFEMGWTTALIRLAHQEKPLLFLKHASLREGKNSSLVRGNPHAKFEYYDKETVGNIVENFMRSVEQEGKITRERE